MASDLITRMSNAGGFGGGALTSGGGGGFLPGTPNQYDPAYGGVPNVPSPQGSQSSAIGGNISNAGNIYNLATQTGSSSGAGVIAALNSEIPSISGSIASATGGINQLLSGQVPDDVITQMRQQAAELGAGSGMGPMAPVTNASYLRALGLTSLGMKEQGMTALNSLMTSVPRAPAFDPSSMLVTPAQQQEWAYLAQVLKNAPNPAAAAKANLDAARMGMGAGGAGGGPVGGFNLPVRGGPAFATPPLTSPGYGPDVTYGATGTADPYSTPSDAAYTNWQNMMRNLPGSTPMSDEDRYNLGLSVAAEPGTEEWYNQGLTVAEEPSQIQNYPAAGYDPYGEDAYYANSADALYGE